MKLEKEDFLKYYNQERKPDTHKGDYGHVFIVAGSEGMTGAAMLCAESAIRTGAGLVYLFSPGKLLPIYETSCKEAVKIKIGDDNTACFEEKHIAQIIKTIKKAGKQACAAVGPGLGNNPQIKRFVQGLMIELKNSDIPVILDADGLNACADMFDKEENLPENLVITPHTKELSRFMGMTVEYINENRIDAALKTSRKIKAITVLKGNKTLVSPLNAADGKIYVNTTGNAGMATGGSGDVLTGIIAGLIASDGRENPIFEIVCCAVFIHGLCGDIAAEKYGQRAVKAGDLTEMLKEVNSI